MTEPGIPNNEPATLPIADVAAPVAIPVAESAPAVAIPVDAAVVEPPPAAEPVPVAVPASSAAPPTPSPDSVETARRLLRSRWPSNARHTSTMLAFLGAPEAAAETAPAPAEAVVPPDAKPTPTPAPTPAPPPAPPNGPGTGDVLDERLRRLESMLVKLADSRAEPPAAPTSNLVQEVSRRILPAALDALARPGEPAVQEPRPEPRSPWLLFDIATEMRSILHMYGDPRYRLTWPGRIVPPLMLVLIFISWILIPGTTMLPSSFLTIFDKVLDLIFAYFLFKVLSREARRYRETVPPAEPPSLRL